MILLHRAIVSCSLTTTYADISKAQWLLGYYPTTTIEDGISNFVEWFREHNASQYRMAM